MPRPNRKLIKKPLNCLKFSKIAKVTLPQTFRQQKIQHLKPKEILIDLENIKNVTSLTPLDQEENGCIVKDAINQVEEEEIPAESLHLHFSAADNQTLFAGEIDPHQCSKEDALQYLHQFDLARQYGPCSNMTRYQRFNRAKDNALNPPQSVKIIIERFLKEYPPINSNVWDRHLI